MVGRDRIDINHQHVCILTAVDRSNNIYIEPITSGAGKAQDVYDKLQPRISKDAVLVTDEHKSYKYFVREESIKHIQIKSGEYAIGPYSLSRVNNLHGRIKGFVQTKGNSPATKYLDLYLMMLWWLEKNKDFSSSDLNQKLSQIMTGCVSNETRAKMKRITIKDLSTRALPIDLERAFSK